MGYGMSTELGKDSLHEETRHEMDHALQRVRSDDPALVELDLCNRAITNAGLEVGSPALTTNNSLKQLDLSYNKLKGDSGVALLCQGLQNNGSVLKLNLAGNQIGDAGVKPLAVYLQSNPQLEVLSLYHCGLTDEAVLILANALQRNKSLVRLNLAMNYLTNKSCIMLSQLMKTNKGLAEINLDNNKTPMDSALLEAMAEPMAANLETYERRIHSEKIKAHKAELRRQREKDAEERRLKEEAEEQQRYKDEQASLEAKKAREEEELRLFELEMAKKRKGLTSGEEAAERARKHQQEWVDRAVDQAYKWRDKMTSNGQLVKEWRSGFTVMQTEPGSVPGTLPSIQSEVPRRLKACWCDPQDTAASPYAKTLHYHCKHEQTGKSDDIDGETKYCGCQQTGHVCSSVGFYSKPLPDRSASHFFASQHPNGARSIVDESADSIVVQ